MADKKYALVLSGGGARGAYEVGVLKFLFQELPRKYGFVPNFQVICGTSVGAIHACYLAAHLKEVGAGLNRLSSIWENLQPSQVVNFDVRQAIGLKDLLLGGEKASGLLDVTPLKLLLQRESAWHEIGHNIDAGLLETLCVSSTSTRTGKTCVFTETEQPLPSDTVFRTHFEPVEMCVDHAMASASLPILFPPVKINNEWFTDGGIRQNTPIAPAVAFDATHVFTVGLWHEGRRQLPSASSEAPSLGFLIGKIFNSFFIDHAQSDLYNLDNINAIIKEAESFSPGFERHVKTLAKPFREITSYALSPSSDIGRLAGSYLANLSVKENRLYRLMLKMADITRTESDLASYLLFDGGFSKILIDLGFHDAMANEDKILEFFGP